MPNEYSDNDIAGIRYAIDMAREHLRDSGDHHARRSLDYLADAVSALTDVIERSNPRERDASGLL